MANRKFRAAKVWRTLRLNGGLTARQLADKLGERIGPVSTLLVRMRALGQTRSGPHHGRHTQWFYAGEMPEDGRGCHVNSLANLTHDPEENAARLRLCAIAKGMDPDSLGKPKQRKARQYYTGELERCWSIPISGTQQAGD